MTTTTQPPRPTTHAGLLTAARAVLVARGLAQGDYADPDTGCVCAIGAVRLAAGGHQDGAGPHIDPPTDPAATTLADAVIVLLAHHIPDDHDLFDPADAAARLAVWADHPGRTLDEVLALIDTALADQTGMAATGATGQWPGLTLTVLGRDGAGHVIDLNGRDIPLWLMWDLAAGDPIDVVIATHAISAELARQIAAAYLLLPDGGAAEQRDVAHVRSAPVRRVWGRWRPQTDDERDNARLYPDEWDADAPMWDDVDAAAGYQPVTAVFVGD
jgi:hypothetical protein